MTSRLIDSEQVEQDEKQPVEGLLTHLWRGSVHWRWPLLLMLIVALVFEAAWLVYVAPTDATRYECYGLTFWLGSHATTLIPAACSFLPPSAPIPALHMLPIEYPPLTILIFSLPLLVPLPYYTLAFALWMTLVAGLICWLLSRAGGRKAAPIFLLYLVLGTSTLFQVRFDLLPAGCTLLCVIAAERGRWKTAYVALALGILFKIYPIVMLPALFLAEQQARLVAQGYTSRRDGWLASIWEQLRRWNWLNALLCVGLVVVVMGGFALINFNEAIVSPLTYFIKRPVQIESLESSIIWLSSLFGVSYSPDFRYGSFNVVSALGDVLSPLGTGLLIAGILAILVLQWRKKIDFAQAMVALVCVIMTTGKVFSPQYLIWLVPLLAYLYACGKTNRLWMYGWAAICVLTTIVYSYYSQLPTAKSLVSTGPHVLATLPGFFEFVTARNLLLLVATLAFLCNWWGTRKKIVQ